VAVFLGLVAIALLPPRKPTIDLKELDMKSLFTGAAVAAALGLTGVSAHAACVDSRMAGSPSVGHQFPASILKGLIGSESREGGARETIVGTWHASYTVEGAPFADAFIQWHRDGTEWENINLPVLSGNICMGSWKVVDETHVFRNHIGWLYTNGVLTGYFTETETDAVSRDGNSYTGVNEQKIFDMDGNMLADVTGTSTAKRISP
jgi:hypothetical protein